MPWQLEGGGRLADRLDVGAGERATRRIADAGGDALHRNVRDRTPVGPPRKDRAPGTLKASVQRGPTTRRATLTGAGAYGVTVFSDDPIAAYVEWDTRPHDIPGAFGEPEPFGRGGRFDGKFHPGTEGAHMFANGALATLEQVPRFTRGALEQFRREVWRER